MTLAAWVNWNPEPKVHAYGRVIGRRAIVVGLCGVTVREERGTFDPDATNACEDCADYVRRGLTAEQARAATAEKIRAAFAAQIDPHREHRWRQVGRCVYCECGARLYQGTVPKDHPTYTPPRKPTPADEMRERWGKS